MFACYNKIINQREDPETNYPKKQGNTYNCCFFVTIVSEEENTYDFRRRWVQTIIDCLNSDVLEFQYKQDFRFKADETKTSGDVISGKIDSYLMDEDIGGILSRFVYEDFDSVINDEETVHKIFGCQKNRDNCADILKRFWNHWD